MSNISNPFTKSIVIVLLAFMCLNCQSESDKEIKISQQLHGTIVSIDDDDGEMIGIRLEVKMPPEDGNGYSYYRIIINENGKKLARHVGSDVVLTGYVNEKKSVSYFEVTKIKKIIR